MAPLSVEVYNPAAREWIKAGPDVRPGGPSGSISNNESDGTRELYFFECAPDDSKSTIYHSGAGIDADLGALRASVIDPSRLEIVKEVRKGESFEMTVKTDRSRESQRIRFTHR